MTNLFKDEPDGSNKLANLLLGYKTLKVLRDAFSDLMEEEYVDEDTWNELNQRVKEYKDDLDALRAEILRLHRMGITSDFDGWILIGSN